MCVCGWKWGIYTPKFAIWYMENDDTPEDVGSFQGVSLNFQTTPYHISSYIKIAREFHQVENLHQGDWSCCWFAPGTKCKVQAVSSSSHLYSSNILISLCHQIIGWVPSSLKRNARKSHKLTQKHGILQILHGFFHGFPLSKWKSGGKLSRSFHVARESPVILHPEHVGHATAQGNRLGAVDQAPIAAEFHLPGILVERLGVDVNDVNHV